MGHLSSDEDLGMIHESELMKSAIPSLGILKCGTYGFSEVGGAFLDGSEFGSKFGTMARQVEGCVIILAKC